MYVPGTLENTESVLVNIGTGYFVEKVKNLYSCFFFLPEAAVMFNVCKFTFWNSLCGRKKKTQVFFGWPDLSRDFFGYSEHDSARVSWPHSFAI